MAAPPVIPDNLIIQSNSLITQLNDASKVDNKDTLKAMNVIDAKSIVSALGFNAENTSVESIITDSLVKKNYVVHKGFQIPNVPYADEMLRRIISPMYLRHLGVAVTFNNDVMKSDVYKTIPGGLEDSYVASLIVPPGFATNWDARVKEVRDKLIETEKAKQKAFDEKNRITEPTIQTVTVLSSANPVIREAYKKQLDTQFIGSNVVRQPSIFSLGINRSQSGGSVRNLHAPLYPKMVMNGGAHPFAVMSGGESSVDNMTLINDRIITLKQQYQFASGQELPADITKKIDEYVKNVTDGLKGLEKDLNNLRDANGYLAQNPLVNGLPRPSSPTDLETLAQKGREITEKSLKLSKQFGKVSKIESLLEELIKQYKPRSA